MPVASEASALLSVPTCRSEPILARGEVNTTVRCYESMYIVDATLTDEQVDSIIAKYTKLIADQGGQLQAVGRWDKRRLAYEIQGRREGLYILMFFQAEAAVARELDRVYRISDDVFRHLITRVEPQHIDTSRIDQPQPTAEPAAPAEVAAEQLVEQEAAVEDVEAAEEAPAEEAEVTAEAASAEKAEEAAEEAQAVEEEAEEAKPEEPEAVQEEAEQIEAPAEAGAEVAAEEEPAEQTPEEAEVAEAGEVEEPAAEAVEDEQPGEEPAESEAPVKETEAEKEA